MADGVVPRSAREAQPAVHGQLTVHPEPELTQGQLHRRREARVQVHVGDVVDVGSGQGQRTVARHADGGRRGEVQALGHHAVLAVGPRQREHPSILGDAEGLRPLDRADDASRRHVHVGVGHHPLGVREADHAVVLGRRGDLRGGVGVPAPGVGVVPGHLREPRPHLADHGQVLLHASGRRRDGVRSRTTGTTASAGRCLGPSRRRGPTRSSRPRASRPRRRPPDGSSRGCGPPSWP